jgi:hypothetical protein
MDNQYYLFRCLKCNRLDRLDEKGLERYVYPRHGEYACPYGCQLPVVLLHVGTYDESLGVADDFLKKCTSREDQDFLPSFDFHP